MTGDSLSGRRVLVVEDELFVSMALEDMLTDLGCEVIGPAAHLDEAVAMIGSERFDAALLDVNLDGQPSYPVADLLLAASVPILFSTGYHKLSNGYQRLPHLRKPFAKKDLEAALTAILLNRTSP